MKKENKEPIKLGYKEVDLIGFTSPECTNFSRQKEDTLKDKLNKHGQLEDEGAPEDEI